MTAISTSRAISAEFVATLGERAQEGERLRRLPAATVADLAASGFTELLVPARYGGQQAEFPAILDPVRRMAHGCASSAWTIGFYALHNWMLALFDEQAQDEAFSTRPFLAPAPLAPTGRGVPVDGGIRLTGRWSWATGVMDGNWIIVGALCGPDDAIYPALALLPIADVTIDDVWHTDGMRATGSNDVVVSDAFVPQHRLVRVVDIYTGTAPGAALHDADTYRWPMVPALALLAAMPALGSAERVAEIYAETAWQARAGLRGRRAEGQAHRAGPPGRGAGAAARAARTARRHRRRHRNHRRRGRFRARDRCAARRGSRPRTSCTSPAR